MKRGGVAIAIAVLAAACQAPAPRAARPRAGSDRQAYQAALHAAARDRAAGAEALRRFLGEWPRSSLADDAALRLAGALVEEGRDAEAERWLAWALRTHPQGDRADDARLLQARLQRASGRSAAAYRTAKEVRGSLLGREDRAELHRLLAELAAEAGDRAGHLRWLARVRADQRDAAATARADQELERALAALSPAELERAARELGRTLPSGRVRLHQAEAALGAGDPGEAQRLLARASELPLSPSDAERLTALEARLRAGEAPGVAPAPARPPEAIPDSVRARGAIGVVLPLTGALAAAGEAALDGMLLASGVLEGARDGAGAAPGEPADEPSRAGALRLRVRDSGGAPERAGAAVRELGEDPAVLAVLGPLTAEEAHAAAAEAERLALPLLALTRNEDVARGRPHVFRLGITPAAEAEVLADYAVRELGVRRVGILYPEDDYGTRLRALFASALEARGALAAGAAGYAPDATDFTQPVRRLILSAGGTPAAPDAMAEEPEGVPGDLDAVFVPDAHEAAALIAPALAFAGLRGVRLLGTSGFDAPKLVAVGREHVEGAVFTGAVVRESASPMLGEFAVRHAAGFGRPPDALAAQGFDAALLVLRALLAGAASREALREQLVAAEPLAGASGVTDFVADGNAQRRPHLLGVEGGRIVDLEELGRPPLLPGSPAAHAPARNP